MQSVLRYVKNEGLKLRLNLHLVFFAFCFTVRYKKKVNVFFSMCFLTHINSAIVHFIIHRSLDYIYSHITSICSKHCLLFSLCRFN